MNYYLVKFNNRHFGKSDNPCDRKRYNYIYIREDSEWDVVKDDVARFQTFASYNNSPNTDVWYNMRKYPLYTDCFFNKLVHNVELSQAMFLSDILAMCILTEEEMQNTTRTEEQKIDNATREGKREYNLDNFLEGIGLMKAATKNN